MSKRHSLPKAQFNSSSNGLVFPVALDRWNSSIKASDQEETKNTINILDQIGYDWWSDTGITAKNISASLDSMRGQDIVVNINSPGGDVFEGLAIYNLLREHDGNVTVRILGLAASAASFIAMAADEIQIARAGFLMIHNAWTISAGNRNDLNEVASFLEQIDDMLADIYSIQTGIEVDDLKASMDKESWINGKSAVEQGFADSFLKSDVIHDTKNSALSKGRIAALKIDSALARSGITQSERNQLMNDIRSSSNTKKAFDLTSVITSIDQATQQFKS